MPVGKQVVPFDNSDFNNATTTGTWTAASSATSTTDETGNTKATYGIPCTAKTTRPSHGIDKPDTADPTKEPYNAYRLSAASRLR